MSEISESPQPEIQPTQTPTEATSEIIGSMHNASEAGKAKLVTAFTTGVLAIPSLFYAAQGEPRNAALYAAIGGAVGLAVARK